MMNFKDLLAQGRISEAIQLRIEGIEFQAQQYRQDLEAAKISSAVVSLVGIVLSANPLIGILGALGAFGYGVTLYKDFIETKQLCLVPLTRKSLGDIVAAIAEQDDEAEIDQLASVLGYVSPKLAHEYELLVVSELGVTQFLTTVKPDERVNAYQYLLRHTRIRNSLVVPERLDSFQGLVSKPVAEVESLEPVELEQPTEVESFEYDLGREGEPDQVIETDLAASDPIFGDQKTAYSELVKSSCSSYAIFGWQRSGKTYLAAAASYKLNSQRGTKVYHINLASHGREDEGYWQHSTRSLSVDISNTKISYDDVKSHIKEAFNIVKEFGDEGNDNAILVVDEFTYIGDNVNPYKKELQPLMKLLAGQIGVLSRAGFKRQKAIWTIAPGFVAGTLVQEAKSIKGNLLPIFVTIPPGQTVNWNGNPVMFNDTIFRQVQTNWEGVSDPPEWGIEADRIAFINGQWLPIGTLPSLDPPKTKTTQKSGKPETEKVIRLLKETDHKTLWEVAVEMIGEDEPGLEKIKAVVLALGKTCLSCPDLLRKFNLETLKDIRYSYKDARTRRNEAAVANPTCVCCGKRPGQEVHHSRYLGAFDRVGVNLFHVCQKCHIPVCHSKENWRSHSTPEPVWDSHNVPQLEARLQLRAKQSSKEL